MLKARRITKDELAKTDELFRIAFEFPDENAEDNDAILKRMEEHPERRGSRYALEKWAAFDEEGNMREKWEIVTRKENNGERILPDIAKAIADKNEEKSIDKADGKK